MSIKFGTSGWRGILADEFTFPRLRIAVQAIADYLREGKLHNRRVVIGYDTRFLSEEFAKTAAGCWPPMGWNLFYVFVIPPRRWSLLKFCT
ncbi:MAG: hypothetical protein IPN90_10475 [Elusimicrobia bacterium]|nr:hypothetical protein [Elusimicrobiota bacterium]